MKKNTNKTTANLIFVICVLSLCFVASFVLNFFGGFDMKPAEEFDMVLGENLSLKLDGYGSQSAVLMFSGKSLPGDSVKQSVQVKLPNLELDNYTLRAKAYVGQSTAFTNVTISGFLSWELNEQDGYYYYQEEITKLQEIGVCTDITLPTNITLKSNINYALIFTVELIFNQA